MKIENNFYARVAGFNSKVWGNEDKISENEGTSNFQSILKKCIDDVNEKSIESNNATSDFVTGQNDISIDEVMMKATEADLSLQFLTTTRDKLVEGYKELIKMSV